MNFMMKNKLSPSKSLAWFTQLSLCLMFSIVCCNCNNSCTPGSDPETDQPDLVVETPVMTLTGPGEKKGAKVGDTDFGLTLAVTQGTVNTAEYTLRATTVKYYVADNYNDDYLTNLRNDYSEELTDPTLGTTVDSMNGKTLQELVTDDVLNLGDQRNITITVTTHSGTETNINGENVEYNIWSESAKFKFEILDGAGNVVAGPVNVDWTTAT